MHGKRVCRRSWPVQACLGQLCTHDTIASERDQPTCAPATRAPCSGWGDRRFDIYFERCRASKGEGQQDHKEPCEHCRLSPEGAWEKLTVPAVSQRR